VQFKKGSYYAEEGDFSAAGAVNVNYVNVLDKPLVEGSGGTEVGSDCSPRGRRSWDGVTCWRRSS
jgi:hypothetical protein